MSGGLAFNYFDNNAAIEDWPVGFSVTTVITFFASWILFIVHFGYLLGVGLCWLPSLIVAFMAGLLWPVVAVAIPIIAIIVIRGYSEGIF